MTVITRFAPSPTGFLHIGSARTALFNWLYAKHTGGKFLLRIEDTDRARSTEAAVNAILDGMKWLGLDWDGEEVYQFARTPRHAEVAHELVKQGKAYYCYTAPEELAALRETAEKDGKQFKFSSPWRNADSSTAPKDIKPVVRLKAPQEGETVIEDLVQGRVVVANSQLDDMVLLRSDGTPTYMLAVVVDDHDMNVTHIIRGDDHLTNAFRQKLLYEALNWEVPKFAHIPLIHGPDGAKLSKRHGALGIEAYRDMGYLAETLRNYLLRLGWSHGDSEIISTEQAIEWFNIESIGKSPSRIDFKKLDNLNAHYIKHKSDEELAMLIRPAVEKAVGSSLSDTNIACMIKGMKGLKQRAKTLVELANNALIYAMRNAPNQAAQEILAKNNIDIQPIINELTSLPSWDESSIKAVVEKFVAEKAIKLGEVAQIIRIALTGSTVSPSVFEIMEALGKEESINRLSGISK
jgi:glutamyl-tRNA synthetase